MQQLLCTQYGESFPRSIQWQHLLTERPFTTSKYILLHLCATGKDGEAAVDFPLIHQELNQTVRAREVQTRQGWVTASLICLCWRDGGY